jgi:hypothetical protein
VIRALSRPLGLLVATLVCLCASILSMPAAHADAPALSAQLTGISVTGSLPTSEVVLSGTVTNTGTVPAYGVQVIFWRSTERIRDVATLGSVTHGGDTPAGSRVVEREANYTNLVTGPGPFAAQASADFTIRATLQELGISAGAPYVVGVDVRGNADGSSTFQTLARVRTAVPVAAASTSATAAPLVLFSSAPSLIAGTEFANDHLAAEIASGGRLDDLMDAVEQQKLSWVVDPSLVAELTAMSEGYTVLTAGRTTTGTGAEAAKAWLERLDSLPTAQGYRTLFALPDVAAAARVSDADVLSRAVAAAKNSSVAGLPLIVLPSGLAADAATAAYVSGTGAKAIATRLLSTEATWVKSKIPLLRVSAPEPSTGVSADVGTIQYLAAEAMLLSESGRTQVRVVSTDADLAALQSAPTWVKTKRLSDVISLLPSTETATFTSDESMSGLSDDTMRDVASLARRMDVFSALSPTAPTAQAATQILARAASWTWAGQDRARSAWLAAATAEATASAKPGAVVLRATGRFVMSSNVNEFPITVTNTLAHPVVVKVRLESSYPQRLKVSDSAAITVDAGESRTVNIRPEATVNGIATVTARLATEKGTVIGTPITVTVEATQYGMWGWALVAVSGLVLVGTTAWSLKKSRGRTRAEEAA